MSNSMTVSERERMSQQLESCREACFHTYRSGSFDSEVEDPFSLRSIGGSSVNSVLARPLNDLTLLWHESKLLRHRSCELIEALLPLNDK